MTGSPTIARLLPTVLRMCDKPGALLLRAATFALAVFSLMAGLVWHHSDSAFRYLPAIFAVTGWICVGMFSFYRARIRQGLDSNPPPVVSGGVLATGDDATSTSSAVTSGLQAEMSALSEAYRETQIVTTRFFPRINGAQRALVRAAGGVVNAPYLRYDLRLVLLTFLGTFATVGLSVLGVFICAFALLL